jgi:hypothetical protein
MHVKGFLHKILKNVTHLKRLITITYLVIAVIKERELSVTRLGRALNLPIQERSCIKRADRLIGNKKLHEERIKFYKKEINLLLGSKERCLIIVDWSKIPNTNNHVLRAALVVTGKASKGRALTIYEEVHREKLLSNNRVQKRFLNKLKELIPSKCKTTIITDAGFCNPWFKHVQKLGWDYVGRVRGVRYYRVAVRDNYAKLSWLHKKASYVAKSMGEILLCKRDTLKTFLYLFKGKTKGRKGSKISKQKKSGREPWVLVSSITGGLAAQKVVKIYKQRMQIEEGFRDLKSSYYGLGFEHAYSREIARIEILLLIAMLASLIAWLTGWIAERDKLQYQFQVNKIGSRRILSLFFLGCRVIQRGLKISIISMMAAIKGEGIYAI